ncbi:hypothetical protein SCHPADRAFT_811448, partial [Schizopora paradoxa]
SYRQLQQFALVLSIISVIYCAAEGGVSIGFGAESSSHALTFFGIQSAIEVGSAAIVVWRFRKVAPPGQEREGQISPANLKVEKMGSWAIGISLGVLGITAQVTALIDLANHNIPDSSDASIIISAVCLVIMVIIWYPTNTLAHVLHSSTLEGEAKCSLTCIQMTLVLFIGSLIVRVSKGGWWVNSVTTMLLGRLFEYEAWKTIKWVRDPNFDGGCCGG